MGLIKNHSDMSVSKTFLFESQINITTSFYIKEEVLLKNPKIRVPDLSICVNDEVVYRDKEGNINFQDVI